MLQIGVTHWIMRLPSAALLGGTAAKPLGIEN
jgi:hypothetical protein